MPTGATETEQVLTTGTVRKASAAVATSFGLKPTDKRKPRGATSSSTFQSPDASKDGGGDGDGNATTNPAEVPGGLGDAPQGAVNLENTGKSNAEVTLANAPPIASTGGNADEDAPPAASRGGNAGGGGNVGEEAGGGNENAAAVERQAAEAKAKADVDKLLNTDEESGGGNAAGDADTAGSNLEPADTFIEKHLSKVKVEAWKKSRTDAHKELLTYVELIKEALLKDISKLPDVAAVKTKLGEIVKALQDIPGDQHVTQGGDNDNDNIFEVNNVLRVLDGFQPPASSGGYEFDAHSLSGSMGSDVSDGELSINER